MSVEVRTQAMLLLTVWLKRPSPGDPRPLTATEWGRFAHWLKEHEASPEALLTSEDPTVFLKGFSDPTVTPERIVQLFMRSAALGLALEKWERAGLWVMSRSDFDYPARLKKRLNSNAPPVLFGCGNRELLDRGGIAVIGSREADEENLAFTARLGADIVSQGYSVVSGGARGVDETAMLGALEREGTAIGVLADGLLRTATSAKYRNGLMMKDLVLVSPFNPEAGFDVGNAMGRNKYIYCLADAAVVVTTGRDKGGTWNGAIENLKKAWVPLWVKPHPNESSGNHALVQKGARWLPEVNLDVRSLIVPIEMSKSRPEQGGLFDNSPASQSTQDPVDEPRPEMTGSASAQTHEEPASETKMATQGESQIEQPAPQENSPYDFFLIMLECETRISPETAKTLQHKLGVSKSQLNDWLKRAVAEGRVTKLNKPVRYQTTKTGQRNLEF